MMNTDVTQENMMLGIIGALVGCFLGGIVWVIIGYFGFFASLAGLLIVYLGIKGYEKGARTISKKGLLFVGILSIFTALFATYLGWAFFLVNDYNTYFNLTGATQISVFDMLPVMHEVILFDPSLRNAVILEIVFALIFILIPTAAIVYQYNKELQVAEAAPKTVPIESDREKEE